MSLPWKLGKKPYEKQETRTAKKAGARQQPNSGRGRRKGDVIRVTPYGTFLYDNKGRGHRGYHLSAGDFLKLKKQANQEPPGCIPVFQIDLELPHSKPVRLVVLEEDVFDELLDRL
jgi:hypothetical protein